jgi:hypothetical protein
MGKNVIFALRGMRPLGLVNDQVRRFLEMARPDGIR